MSGKPYHWCVVPMCKNTAVNAPNKIFIAVPKQPQQRKQWLELARRNANELSSKSSLYFCEDHFDLPNDMENYLRFQMVGSKKIQLKKGCLPSKFECQPDRRKRTAVHAPRSAAIKRQRHQLVRELTEASSSIAAVCEETSQAVNEPVTEIDVASCRDDTAAESKQSDKAVQVAIRVQKYFRSKGTQYVSQVRDASCSPFCYPSHTTTATSPFKSIRCVLKPTVFESVRRNLQFDEPGPSFKATQKISDSDSSYVPSNSDSSYVPSSEKGTSESEWEYALKAEEEAFSKSCLNNTMAMIKKRPRYYVGIPKDCYFLIDILAKHCEISHEHIVLCLKKIRLNSSFIDLADCFGINSTYASKIFAKCIPKLAQNLKPFIIKIDPQQVKKNLPIAFRCNYSQVSCIIDCLEIEIQKPSKSVHQALTWSEYKKANTIKYLVSCTPDGVINYISAGYGGRISDVALVEVSDFLQTLLPGSCVLADRGFKNIEKLLFDKGCKLIRPPSVTFRAKLTKDQARETKQVASLRIHIERAIRRIREFSMLKGHSVINNKLINMIDDIIIIACALINLQGPLIRV